jgi:hypothetical protein
MPGLGTGIHSVAFALLATAADGMDCRVKPAMTTEMVP